jgi:hypothetical protein
VSRVTADNIRKAILLMTAVVVVAFAWFVRSVVGKPE